MRLRPIMMTALVACLGLLPAAPPRALAQITEAFCHRVVAGLVSRLLPRILRNPVLYQMVAKEGDVLQV